ncbi:MAG TPA: hypothetical protein ENK75_05850 [Saprospiraceae bacterium]|nr:hypothetical protein [Saprospiraceae bacterium]
MGYRLEKKRYIIEEDGYLFEIDEYLGRLKGLLVAEVEFLDTEVAVNFEKRDWMQQEITHINFMKNKKLLKFSSLSEVLTAIKGLGK